MTLPREDGPIDNRRRGVGSGNKMTWSARRKKRETRDIMVDEVMTALDVRGFSYVPEELINELGAYLLKLTCTGLIHGSSAQITLLIARRAWRTGGVTPSNPPRVFKKCEKMLSENHDWFVVDVKGLMKGSLQLTFWSDEAEDQMTGETWTTGEGAVSDVMRRYQLRNPQKHDENSWI